MKCTLFTLILLGWLLPFIALTQPTDKACIFQQSDLACERIEEMLGQQKVNPLGLRGSEYQLSAIKTQRGDSLNWKQRDSIQYFYNDNNNISLEIKLKWRGRNWSLKERTLYTYDSNSSVTERLIQSWNGREWSHSKRFIMSYNSDNKLELSIRQIFTNGNWQSQTRVLVKYNELERRAEYTREGLDVDGWHIGSRTIFEYTKDDKIALRIFQIAVKDSLNNLIRNEYYFNSEGNKILDFEFSWRDSLWVNWKREILDYDGAGNNTYAIVEVLQGGEWLNAWQIENTYDASNNLLSTIVQLWRNEAWLNNYLWNYLYDNHNSLTLKTIQEWEGNWINKEREYYYYDLISATENDGDLEAFTLYPNPNNGQFRVDLKGNQWKKARLNIIDNSGRLIISKSLNEGDFDEIFNYYNLPNGHYTLQFVGDEWSIIRRFVVQK